MNSIFFHKLFFNREKDYLIVNLIKTMEYFIYKLTQVMKAS